METSGSGTPLFELGRVVATRGANAVLSGEDVQQALQRHVSGDWGEVDADDARENVRSVAEGWRILSAYRSGDDTRFWIITEADRSATTVLLPEEY